MSVHVGNHAGTHSAEKKNNFDVILLIFAIAVLIYGAYAFADRDITSYLFLKNQFVFFDPEQSRILFMVDHAAIMCLFACVGAGISKGLKRLDNLKIKEKKDEQTK